MVGIDLEAGRRAAYLSVGGFFFFVLVILNFTVERM